MSSAAMASSSVSQEDMENDFERTSRRSRIRMARGRDVRGQHLAAAASRIAADAVAEAEDGGEQRPLDGSGYAGDHDASPKPAARAKDKRPVRPSHPNKGKQTRDRDRRKLREKRRSSGVVHMPSTEMSSTGGSTSEDEESPAGPAPASAESRRSVPPAPESAEAACADPVPMPLAERHYKSPRRNKSLSDLDADDEDNNQDCDSLGPPDTPAAGAVPPPSPPLEPPAARLIQLEEENNRLRQLLAERDRRIAGLEATAAEHHQLRMRNDALTKALSSLTAK